MLGHQINGETVDYIMSGALGAIFGVASTSGEIETAFMVGMAGALGGLAMKMIWSLCKKAYNKFKCNKDVDSQK